MGEELAKTVGVWRGTAMMLSVVLGAGLLTLPGLAVQSAGNAALLIWGACAIAAAPLLLVFGILGRRFPNSGGLASVMKHAFGPAGYIVATFLLLGAVAVGLPAIALTGGYYAAAMLGGPAYVYALLLLVGAALINFLSTEIAGRINETIASVLIVVIAAIAVIGIVTTAPTTSDFDAIELPTLPVFGATFMMLFFAFTGWEVSANLSGEFKNPNRDVPTAMLLSFVIAISLYGALAVIVHSAKLDTGFEAPFVELFRREFGAAGAAAIGFVSVFLILANLSAAVWAVSRMVYSAANERLLPAKFSVLRRGVPLNAVFATVVVLLSVVVASSNGFLDLSALLSAAGQNFILLYAGSAAALIQLSRRSSDIVLGWACILMVAGLLIVRGIEGVYYPALLIVLGVVFTLRRSPNFLVEPIRAWWAER